MASPGSASAWGSLAAGLASVATLPVAVYLTRFSESYELLHAGFAIPLAGALGMVAIALAARTRRIGALRLRAGGGSGPARAGRILGLLGVGLALAGVVALVVYALLEYAGTRD